MKRFWRKRGTASHKSITGWRETPFTKLGEKHAPKDGRRRVSHYKKYFRGYSEVRQLTTKGRVTVQRVYTQPWLVSGLSTAKYWLLRLLYVVLAALSTACLIGVMVQRIPINYTWMVLLPGIVSAILLFLLWIALLSYVFVERKMTLWGHHSSTVNLKRYSLATSIVQLVTAVVMAVVTLITQLYVLKSLLCAGGILLASICSGAILFIERKVPYKEVVNDTKLPNGKAHAIW